MSRTDVMANPFDEIRVLIANDDLGSAILLLNKQTIPQSKYAQETILLMSKYNELKSNLKTGLMPSDFIYSEINSIRANLLNLSFEIEQSGESQRPPTDKKKSLIDRIIAFFKSLFS